MIAGILIGLILVSLCRLPIADFQPSVSILLSNAQLNNWNWQIVNQGQSICGFTDFLNRFHQVEQSSGLEETEEEQEKLYLGLHCEAITAIEKRVFYDNRHLFIQMISEHYEKNFIYYNVELSYEVKFRQSGLLCLLSEEEITWLRVNPWYLHIQFSGHAPSLTSIPIFGDISWSNQSCNNDLLIVQGRYSNNIGWLFESGKPEEDDAITLDIAINLHPSSFHSLFNDTSEMESNILLFEKRMNNLMKKIHVVINRIGISFVSQPSKVPLNYTIANIDVQLNQQQASRYQISSIMEALNVCRLHETLDGQVLANINIAKSDNTSRRPRLFCGIFTMASNHHKARAIRNTWAKKCTFFMAFSTEDDLSIPAINLAHIGEEKYNNMWQKTRSIWKYIHEFYIHDFDWFLLGGDDMYHIVENLMDFLTSDEIRAEQQLQQEEFDTSIADLEGDQHEYDNNWNESNSEPPQSIPGSGLYLGRRLLLPGSEDKGRQMFFNSGGPGYLLDRKALNLYIRNADKSFCFPNVLRYAEDAYLAGCLIRTKESLFPYDSTNDKQGKPRFHIFSPAQTYSFDTSDRVFWLNRFDPFMKNGSECCSPSSISFHNISESLMYAIDDYLYRCNRI
jgi:glycoprotein-N-acetylgalactosamine 3-beta-galactosyltransferase